MADNDPTTGAPKRPRARRKPVVDAPSSTAATPEVITPAVVPGSVVVIEAGAPIETDSVTMRRSAVGRIEGGRVTVDQGAVGAVRADQMSVDRGAVGAVMAGEVEISRGYARSILARQVQIDRGAARVVIAADVRAQQSSVMFLVARRVSGDMRVMFDWRGALAFGAAAGVVFGLLARARRKPR
jgi:hypothetical protein